MIVSMFTMTLSAKDIYIRVVSVENKDILFNISYKLNELGYKTFATRYKDWNRVYTGPFKNRKSANRALILIQKHVSKDAFITNIDINAKENTISQSKKIKKQKKRKPSKIESVEVATDSSKSMSEKEEVDNSIIAEDKYSRFFIGVSGGTSKFDVEEVTLSGSVPLDIVLEDSGMTYGAEVGYYFNKHMFLTLNYQQSTLENVSFAYMFTSLNYKFSKIYGVSPYLGALVGYNAMSWKNDPIDTTEKNDMGFTFNMGAHIGLEVPLGDYFSIFAFYRYINLDHKTELSINSGEKEILHNSEQNFNLGLKINF